MSEETNQLERPPGAVFFGSELDRLLDPASVAPVQQAEVKPEEKKEPAEPKAKEKPVVDPVAPVESTIPAPDNPNLADDPVEAPVAQADDDDEFPEEAPDPSIDKQKANASWKKIRGVNKERKKQVAELEARVREAEAKAQSAPQAKPEEIEALATKVADYEAKIKALQDDLSVSRVDKHPDYQARVTAPISDAVATIKKLAVKYEVSENRLAGALKAGDEKALEELIDGFSTLDAGLVATAYRDVEKANAAREELESRAGDLVAQMDRENVAGRALRDDRMRHEFKGAVNGAIEALRTTHSILRKVDGNEQWNRGLEDVARRLAETDPNSLSTEEVADAVAKAAHFPYWESAYSFRTSQVNDLKKRLAAAEATVKSLKAVDAGLGIGGTRQPEDDARAQAKQDANMSFAEGLEARLAALGA